MFLRYLRAHKITRYRLGNNGEMWVMNVATNREAARKIDLKEGWEVQDEEKKKAKKRSEGIAHGGGI